MNLYGPGRLKLERKDSWQQTELERLCSDLFQALKGEPWTALASQLLDIHF